jgi:hypothetical protein
MSKLMQRRRMVVISTTNLRLRHHPRPLAPIRIIIILITTLTINTNHRTSPSISSNSRSITRCTLRLPLLRLKVEAPLSAGWDTRPRLLPAMSSLTWVSRRGIRG